MPFLVALLIAVTLLALREQAVTFGKSGTNSLALAGLTVAPNLYELSYTAVQTDTIDTSFVNNGELFSAANLIISSLAPIFMFIAGLSLGSAILGAIVRAIGRAVNF